MVNDLRNKAPVSSAICTSIESLNSNCRKNLNEYYSISYLPHGNENESSFFFKLGLTCSQISRAVH